MIAVDSLVKQFTSPELVTAVDQVSFEARPGEVFGLLGPNGAGKTTTLRVLATLLSPDAGTAVIAGHDVGEDPVAVRASIGFLSGSTGLYGKLTAREMILYFARLQGVADPESRTQALLERFEITDYADKRCGQLSTGMAQKVSIARAVVHDPPVLILDEPTSGLDVIVGETFMRFIEEARARDKTVLFSTHTMSEAERLCDRIGIIHNGRTLASGTLDELRQDSGEPYLERIFVRLVEREEARSR